MPPGCSLASIASADRFGVIAYAIAIAIAAATAAWIALRRRRVPSPVLLVAAAHPGLWWSTRGGDCGKSMYVLAFAGWLVVGCAAVFALWRVRRR